MLCNPTSCRRKIQGLKSREWLLMATALQVRGLSVSFDGETFLEDINFAVEENEIIALVGGNGSGKTTLLRAICGLQDISKGSILLNDKEISGQSVYKRGIGLVFQQTLLMPQLDVAGNLAIGIPRSITKKEIPPIIEKALEDIGLSGFQRRKVSTLSGGEAQRISLMRALLAEPKFLLMDEPLVNQDIHNKKKLGEEIRDLLKQRGVAALIVTHQPSVAESICDRVLYIDSLKGGEEG
ncbi:MAG TPA: ABC transporter ATP-binding protein [Candidatus Poseidoniales archaeon]|nr:MAG: ABC transporter [Euryarchaeota archaeon]HIF16591.1 ABC transporter ATP-binding protein [Candidatus Poseidoniales archaeon]